MERPPEINNKDMTPIQMGGMTVNVPRENVRVVKQGKKIKEASQREWSKQNTLEANPSIPDQSTIVPELEAVIEDTSRTFVKMQKGVKARKELLESLEPQSKQEEKLIKKLKKGKSAERIEDKHYKTKGRWANLDLSLSGMKRKLLEAEEGKYVGEMEKKNKAIEKNKKLSLEEKDAAKKELFLKYSERSKEIELKERIQTKKRNDEAKRQEDLEARREAREREFSPRAKKGGSGRIAGIDSGARTPSSAGIESAFKPESNPAKEELSDKIKRTWGEELYPQFLAMKDEGVYSIIHQPKKNAWQKFYALFNKEFSDDTPEKKMAMEKIRELFNSVKNNSEKFILSGMTVEQFLRRTLK